MSAKDTPAESNEEELKAEGLLTLSSIVKITYFRRG